MTGSFKSLVYDMGFPDGPVKQDAENFIAKNALSQVDSSGFHSQFLSCITHHEQMDNAVN